MQPCYVTVPLPALVRPFQVIAPSAAPLKATGAAAKPRSSGNLLSPHLRVVVLVAVLRRRTTVALGHDTSSSTTTSCDRAQCCRASGRAPHPLTAPAYRPTEDSMMHRPTSR